MTDIATLQAAAHDPVPALRDGLILEFGNAADTMPTARFVDAEAADFHWEARVDARRIGTVEPFDDDDEASDCFLILGYLDARWFVARLDVDREGSPREIRGVRGFTSVWDAYEAYEANG